MKIRMTLMSDTIFGNGMSVPGGEDISVLHDAQGFPYYRGSTFKGVFREMLVRYLEWNDVEDVKASEIIRRLLGKNGDTEMDSDKLVFSDFCIPENVRSRILNEIGDDSDAVLDSFTHTRTFTAIDENGTVKNKSMRVARCVNKGIVLDAVIRCGDAQPEMVKEVLSMIKWIGTMRNRGFGKVRIEEKEA